MVGTHKKFATIAVAASLALGLAACDGAEKKQGPSATPSVSASVPSQAPSQSSSAPTSVQQALAQLPVKGRAPKTGYSREQFGPRWTDDNVADLKPGGYSRNGCDTRNDVLARDMAGETLASGGCKVLAGTLLDPYTGTTIEFLCRKDALVTQKCEPGPAALVQIDHVVALSDAWQKGAQQLTVEQRTALANDPLNLFAVDGATNEAKSDGDYATWKPANKQFRCTYVAHQVAVKLKYQLWVTQAEKAAMAEQLALCPQQELPR